MKELRYEERGKGGGRTEEMRAAVEKARALKDLMDFPAEGQEVVKKFEVPEGSTPIAIGVERDVEKGMVVLRIGESEVLMMPVGAAALAHALREAAQDLEAAKTAAGRKRHKPAKR